MHPAAGKAPFERVVEEHGTLVWRVCRGMLDEHDAEDAWSETFLAAMRAWPAFDGNTAGWLVTIAHRKAIDVLRARARTAIPTDEVPEADSRLGVPEARDLDLWAALKLLPPRQRAAVVHHHLAGRAVQRGRRPHRHHPGRGPQGRLGRRAAAPRPARREGDRMTETLAPLTVPDADPALLARLHARLEAAAVDADAPDVHYRRVDSPLGPLLVAATETGVTRLAFSIEDEDGVLDELATRVGPRVLRVTEAARPRRPLARRLLRRRRRAVRRRASTCASRAASGWPCSSSCSAVPLRRSRSATPRSPPEPPNPRAVRAVGTACATNPVPLVVPCHRVVRSDGTTGAYRGGAAAKVRLLALERDGVLPQAGGLPIQPE